MNSSDLNLARKWRSKNFDQIVGQDISIRILRNGLYLNSFFPVYLFSGQRGCGKTSTARIFAAAVNCQELENYQKDVKNYSVPCLKCISCESMQNGKHPDFIEIDAASHTGVDNVRNIIEASALLPLIGRKKIYLIDEAHMLSKAAFNAFLKILEEPPASVLFILATTDVQKIIDTVRSRSFQLFFTSIETENLISHLENICKNESIKYDLEGLKIIVRESEGSARDAINLLEQVRFSNSIINKKSVLTALGHLSEEQLLNFFDLLVNKKDSKLFLTFLDEINFYNFSAEYVWNRLLELLRFSIRMIHGVNIKDFSNEIVLKSIVANSSLNFIIYVMDEFCKNELIFLKSINKSLFLELLCLKIINSNLINSEIVKTKILKSNDKNNIVPNIDTLNENRSEAKKDISHNEWQNFIQELKKRNDPLLESVFSQADFLHYDKESGIISISFSKKFTFFQELINDTTNNWLPLLRDMFNDQKCSLNINFSEKNENSQEIRKERPGVEKQTFIKSEKRINNEIDISDQEKWKMANLLTKHFPGKIIEIQENINE